MTDAHPISGDDFQPSPALLLVHVPFLFAQSIYPLPLPCSARITSAVAWNDNPRVTLRHPPSPTHHGVARAFENHLAVGPVRLGKTLHGPHGPGHHDHGTAHAASPGPSHALRARPDVLQLHQPARVQEGQRRHLGRRERHLRSAGSAAQPGRLPQEVHRPWRCARCCRGPGLDEHGRLRMGLCHSRPQDRG